LEAGFLKMALLIVNGGLEAVPGIMLAKEMGLHVVVSDQNPQAPGFAWADDCLLASTYDMEATVAAASRYHHRVRRLDGVMCLAADVPLTVAGVAAALGLPGISLESARLASDKLAMKQKFAADGVPIPWFSQVESPEHLRRLVAEQGLPLVLKPVDSRGARGVLRLTGEVDLAWAYQESHRHSPTGRVMVERFLPGPQVSTESLVLAGITYTPGFSDRNYEYLERFAPCIIENGGELPSFLPDNLQAAVREVVARAALSLGITDGVVKGDLVVSQDRAYVIEVAARLSGGYFCTHEIPLSTGVSTIKAVIRQALGEPLDPRELRPRFHRGVVQRYLFPRPGRVVSIRGVDQARQLPGVAEILINVGAGDVVREPTDSNAAAGMVLAVGDTRAEALQRATAAVEIIQVETEP
jgi:biotin carboxylase